MKLFLLLLLVLCISTACAQDPNDPSFPGRTGCRVPEAQLRRDATRRFTKSNVVVRNVYFANGVEVLGRNVVFEDCVFEAAEHSVVQLGNGVRLEMRHVTIRGRQYRQGNNLRWPSNGIRASGWTCRWCDISRACDGAKANGDVLIENSWVHDLKVFPDPEQGGGPSHPDCIQVTQGNNIVIRNNRMDGRFREATSSMKLTAAAGTVSGLTVTGNRLFGGSATLYVNAQNGQPCPRNVLVKDNYFVKGSWKFFALYNRNCKYPASQWARNIEIDASERPKVTKAPTVAPKITDAPGTECPTIIVSAQTCSNSCVLGNTRCFDACRASTCRRAPSACKSDCFVAVWRSQHRRLSGSTRSSSVTSSQQTALVVGVTVGVVVAIAAIALTAYLVVRHRRASADTASPYVPL